MYIEVTKTMFMDAFRSHGRYEEFGYDGLSLLYDYLMETDPDMELDVIELSCKWCYQPLEDVLEDYDMESIEDLRDATIVLENNTFVLYQVF